MTSPTPQSPAGQAGTADLLTDSQRFQVSEARDTLALWTQNRDFAGNYSTERTLADLARNLLAIIGSLGTGNGEEASSLLRTTNRRWVEPGTPP